MDDLYRGQRIGKYEILTQLTLGGMAELFLAFTSGPGGFRKYVVVKRILPDVKADEQFVKMFLDEARITAAFSHPNIAQVFDLGEEEEGLYLAMEFIAGQNLNQVAGACRRSKQPLPIGLSAAVSRDVCNALHYAHTFTDPVGNHLPVIHRDVAHTNVMVAYDGVTRLLDFGIAKARGRLGRTHAGMVKGTTGYMSPEQVRGEELDGRSDVFAVGVMLHELFTGYRLFSAASELEEMELVLNGVIPRVQELNPLVSDDLATVVHRALARERADRWPTARELSRALERAAAPVLFDHEQVSAFMRELFRDKVSATRALLESAGVPDSTLARAAVAQLRADEGTAFLEPAPRRPLKRDTRPTAGRPRAKPAPDEAPAHSAEPARKESHVLGTLAAVALSLLIVGGGFAVYHAVFALPPAPGDVISAKQKAAVPFAAPQPEFPLPPAAAPATPTAVAAPPAPSVGSAPVTEEAEPVTRRPASRVSEGTLTLVTYPESTVTNGRKVLGRTPLFNAVLPAGTHLLRLQGADGKTHVLSAPIKAGRNTRFRLKLAELPAAPTE